MRRLLLVCAFLAAAIGAQPAAASTSPGKCDENCWGTGSVGRYDGGLFAHLGVRSPERETPGGQLTVSATGPLIEYRYVPLCDGKCQTPEVQKFVDALGCQPNQTAVEIDQRTVNSSGQWVLQGTPECLTAAQQLGYDPAQLQAYVDNYFQRIPLPAPQLRVAPADNAVVNLPEIVSADAPATTTFTVNVAPFPAVAINAGVSWEWAFGDGTTLVTSSPGRPYDVNDPDATDYIRHTYTRASAGWPLSVTSVWTATYTVDGVPGQLDVNGTVRRTTTRTLAAADYGSVLTGN